MRSVDELLRTEWATSIRDQCAQAGVPFFFKRWGGVRERTAERALEGRLWDEMPSPPAPQPEYVSLR